MSSSAPYRIPRLILLTLVQWTAVVVGGLAARSLVILQDRERETAESPLPNAVLHGGKMVAASATLVAAVGVSGFAAFFIALILTFKPQRAVPRPAVYILAFCIIFLLAANLYTTCTGTLTEAFITTQPQLPEAVLKGAVAAKGESLVWFDTPEVLGHVIVGWFTWLFLVLAVALEFMAGSRGTNASSNTGMQQRSPDSANSLRSDEKGTASTDEHV